MLMFELASGIGLLWGPQVLVRVGGVNGFRAGKCWFVPMAAKKVRIHGTNLC